MLENGKRIGVPAAATSTSSKDPMPRWKRCLDLAVLAFVAPVLGPILGLIALLIKAVSPGPIVFRQERVGLHGRKFTCLKFRTMRASAETEAHRAHLVDLMSSAKPMVKLDAVDQRIIPIVGPLLRATGFDELLQVVNILRGDMSIVGPRPCITYEYEKFGPQERARFNAVPGLTGLWQVSGKNATTFQEMIALDIRYAEKLSLRNDLLIICRTPAVIFIQVGQLIRRKLPWERMLWLRRVQTEG